MKNLKQISKKASEYILMSGYDLNKVRKAMESNSFALQVCETRQEMYENGCDYSYPYVILNPYNLNIKTENDDFYLCYFDSNCFNDLQYLRNNIYELGARTAKWCGNWDGLKFERFSAKINEEVENKIMDFIQYNGLNIDLNK